MDKVVKITTLNNKNSDFEYWISKSYLDRLLAIEYLRSQYIKFLKDAKPGFQRVCRIIDQTQG